LNWLNSVFEWFNRPQFNPKKSKRRQILPGSKDSTTPQMPVMVSAQTKATLGVT
jgi:hypothetical protein